MGGEANSRVESFRVEVDPFLRGCEFVFLRKELPQGHGRHDPI